MSRIAPGTPFASGLVVHLDQVGDGYRSRMWHNGAQLAEERAATPGKAIAALVAAARELGVEAFAAEIEREVTRELTRRVFGRGFDA